MVAECVVLGDKGRMFRYGVVCVRGMGNEGVCRHRASMLRYVVLRVRALRTVRF